MNKFRIMSVFVVLAMLFSFANVSPAKANPAITTVPPGLNPGDQYRLVFVTEGRTTSFFTSPITYNNFVTTQANQEPDLVALGTSWRAIVSVCTSASGSTCLASVDARTNTNTNPNVAVGVPIYRLDGMLVASDNAGLWGVAGGDAGGTTINNPISLNQFGVVRSSAATWGPYPVWTGTVGNGTAGGGRALGAGSCCKLIGRSDSIGPNNTENGWIWKFGNVGPFNLPVYAISGILTVPITNTPPTADAGGPYYGSEGFLIQLNGSASSDPDGNPLTYNWIVSDPGVCTFDDPTIANPKLTCIDNGDFPTEITVNDGIASDNDDTVVYVQNLPPEADLNNTGPINEGGSASVSFSNAFDYSSADTAAGFHYAFDCNGGSLAAETYAGSGTSDSTSCAFADNGSFDVTGRIMDKDDGFEDWVTIVTVNNVAPTLDAISVDTVLVPVNTAINASATFTDPGVLDTHTAAWDWGDGTSAGTVTQDAGSGSVNDSHSYSTPGVYTVKLTVTDNDLADSNESVYQYVVVYDPSGGFVTGGGWIDSPVNANYQYMQTGGKANFGFVAKYKNGANVPDGNTQFQFKAGDLNFHSSSYEWLVVAGNKAQFKGEGTINGQGSYNFMITADDDNPDTFRIKIWYEENGVEVVVYDNGSQQALGGGSIKVHK